MFSLVALPKKVRRDWALGCGPVGGLSGCSRARLSAGCGMPTGAVHEPNSGVLGKFLDGLSQGRPSSAIIG